MTADEMTRALVKLASEGWSVEFVKVDNMLRIRACCAAGSGEHYTIMCNPRHGADMVHAAVEALVEKVTDRKDYEP